MNAAPRTLRAREIVRRVQSRGSYQGYRVCIRDVTAWMAEWEAAGIVERQPGGWRLSAKGEREVGAPLRESVNALEEAA